MKSIIQKDKECYFCGAIDNLDRHHCIGGTANRRLSEQDGLWVYLCKDHHTMSSQSVHQDENMNKVLKKIAQKEWEKTFGTREEFIKRYGKSYL